MLLNTHLSDNYICRPYRGVSVQSWDGVLEAEAVRAVLVGREAYRRTEFLVLRHGPQTALARVRCAARGELFNPITAIDWIAGPADCAYVVAPDTDTANATALARAATLAGGDRRVYVVEGRYQHVNFIHQPRPVTVRVIEVVPPEPPKLYDLAQRVVDYDELLPPVRLELRTIDLHARAATAPAAHYLLPCRSGGVTLAGEVSFLDERPPHAHWTLIGCDRSRQLHRWFYGEEPEGHVELCPDRLAGDAADGPTLLKCCLLEEGMRSEPGRVVVPWGADLETVRAALRALLCP
ncbi:MAG: hypothetical protein M3357_08650 [Actinomycetota bacterium]|nr:hypothetical protein [Actinomycetota bacterium]